MKKTNVYQVINERIKDIYNVLLFEPIEELGILKRLQFNEGQYENKMVKSKKDGIYEITHTFFPGEHDTCKITLYVDESQNLNVGQIILNGKSITID